MLGSVARHSCGSDKTNDRAGSLGNQRSGMLVDHVPGAPDRLAHCAHRGGRSPAPLLLRLSRHSANVKLGSRAGARLPSDLRRSWEHQISSSSRKRAGAGGA
jgi:hypothetical protein